MRIVEMLRGHVRIFGYQEYSDLADEDFVDISSTVTINSTYVASVSAVNVYKNKHWCVVYIGGLRFKTSGNMQAILSGLPTAQVQGMSFAGGTNAENTATISAQGFVSWIGYNSNILYAHVGNDYNLEHYMTVMYPIKLS